MSGRVQSLKRLGVLQGFLPRLSVQRRAAIGRSPQCAVVRILPARSEPECGARLAHSAAEAPSIRYRFHLSGSEELMALASTRSRKKTEALLHALRRVSGVSRVRPTSILRMHRERPNPPIGSAVPMALHSRDDPFPAGADAPDGPDPRPDGSYERGDARFS